MQKNSITVQTINTLLLSYNITLTMIVKEAWTHPREKYELEAQLEEIELLIKKLL